MFAGVASMSSGVRVMRGSAVARNPPSPDQVVEGSGRPGITCVLGEVGAGHGVGAVPRRASVLSVGRWHKCG